MKSLTLFLFAAFVLAGSLVSPSGAHGAAAVPGDGILSKTYTGRDGDSTVLESYLYGVKRAETRQLEFEMVFFPAYPLWSEEIKKPLAYMVMDGKVSPIYSENDFLSVRFLEARTKKQLYSYDIPLIDENFRKHKITEEEKWNKKVTKLNRKISSFLTEYSRNTLPSVQKAVRKIKGFYAPRQGTADKEFFAKFGLLREYEDAVTFTEGKLSESSLSALVAIEKKWDNLFAETESLFDTWLTHATLAEKREQQRVAEIKKKREQEREERQVYELSRHIEALAKLKALEEAQKKQESPSPKPPPLVQEQRGAYGTPPTTYQDFQPDAQGFRHDGTLGRVEKMGSGLGRLETPVTRARPPMTPQQGGTSRPKLDEETSPFESGDAKNLIALWGGRETERSQRRVARQEADQSAQYGSGTSGYNAETWAKKIESDYETHRPPPEKTPGESSDTRDTGYTSGAISGGTDDRVGTTAGAGAIGDAGKGTEGSDRGVQEPGSKDKPSVEILALSSGASRSSTQGGVTGTFYEEGWTFVADVSNYDANCLYSYTWYLDGATKERHENLRSKSDKFSYTFSTAGKRYVVKVEVKEVCGNSSITVGKEFPLTTKSPTSTQPAQPTSAPPKAPDTKAESKSGYLKVTLQWFTCANLDLWVKDPCGNYLTQGNPKSCNGHIGQSTDANAFCQNLNCRPTETVYWPVAPKGTYFIRAKYLDKCAGSGSTSYTVIADRNGRITRFSGTLQNAGDKTAWEKMSVQVP